MGKKNKSISKFCFSNIGLWALASTFLACSDNLASSNFVNTKGVPSVFEPTAEPINEEQNVAHNPTPTQEPIIDPTTDTGPPNEQTGTPSPISTVESTPGAQASPIIIPTSKPSITATPIVAPYPTLIPTPAQAQIEENGKGQLIKVQQNQVSKPIVDVLFAVDDSGSMMWAQQQLANNFSMFADTVKKYGVAEMQVGVINVNKDDGMLINNKILKSSDINFVQDFKTLVQVGIAGDGLEHGIEASTKAISYVQNISDTMNKKLFRAGSSVNIIYVSDEEEQGLENGYYSYDFPDRDSYFMPNKPGILRGPDQTKYDDAIGDSTGSLLYKPDTKLNQIKGYLNSIGSSVKMHAITSVRDDNSWNGTKFTKLYGVDVNPDCDVKEAGTSYIQAALLTGGIVSNICNNMWSDDIKRIAISSIKLIDTVNLSPGKYVFPGSLVVKVDGAVVSPDKYTYNSVTNSITFNQDFLPGFNAIIDIQYNENLIRK